MELPSPGEAGSSALAEGGGRGACSLQHGTLTRGRGGEAEWMGTSHRGYGQLRCGGDHDPRQNNSVVGPRRPLGDPRRGGWPRHWARHPMGAGWGSIIVGLPWAPAEGTPLPARGSQQGPEAAGEWASEASSSGGVGPGPYGQQTQARHGRRGEKVSGCGLLTNRVEQISAFQTQNPIIQIYTPGGAIETRSQIRIRKHSRTEMNVAAYLNNPVF